ncbi:MAG: TRAP transporter large permease [Gammaproteobacteria bacterium]|jgi:TRAP-type transport system large permease protein|nr:TRAP transporter large permease [Gammaproteobacteria bacterium]MBT5602340.1 TRAP transporter large permease [Gammaproteobacteria bacterium]MBT6247253.1 TRAP transporter large permease [Gammaproteobacteria bacterium]
MSLAYFWIFLFLLAASMPVVFALLIGPGLSLALDGEQVFYKTLLSRLYNGLDSFPLMALPFFILAGQIMNAGGITRSIVDFSQAMIGHVRGGLAQVNIGSSLLFAGLSGSAVADASALGKIFIPAMHQNGYSRPFAAAITAASSVIGPIIPPSGIMILYAFIMNVSVAGLFAAGLVPGVMIAIGLMVMTNYLARKRGYPVANQPVSWRQRGVAFRRTLPALLTPVILLGGILGGVFTPTEAAAVAAVYAILVSVFYLHTLQLKSLFRIFVSSVAQSGIVLLLVGASVAFAWIITVSGLAHTVADGMASISNNVLVLLFLLNIFLLLIGMFLDAGPAVLVLGPVLGPMFISLGIDPLHFAVVMCVNVTVGLATPPMGLVLFVSSAVSRERVETIAVHMLPFLLVEVLVIFLITYFPVLSLALPRWLGFA